MDAGYIISIIVCSLGTIVGLCILIHDRLETPMSIIGAILTLLFGGLSVSILMDVPSEDIQVHSEGEVLPVDTTKKINSTDFIDTYTLKFTDDSIFVFLGDKFVLGTKRIDIPSEH